MSEQEPQHLNLDNTSDSASTQDDGLQDWETVEHPEVSIRCLVTYSASCQARHMTSKC